MVLLALKNQFLSDVNILRPGVLGPDIYRKASGGKRSLLVVPFDKSGGVRGATLINSIFMAIFVQVVPLRLAQVL